MALYSLIENQTIGMDNHQSGTAIAYERSLHIHKRMNKGSKSSLDFRLYFADKVGRIEFTNQRGKECHAIKKEILNSFKDTETCKNFIDSFYEAILPVLNCDRRDISDMRRVAKRAARRIAEALELDSNTMKEFNKSADLYFSKFNDRFYIAVDFTNNKIIAGDDQQEISKFNETRS